MPESLPGVTGGSSVPTPAPGPAAGVFGPALGAAREYAALLAGAGVERGLLGPREVPRLWERHLLNCAVVAALVPPGARVVDVGSGAGLPGVPLALARPDVEVVLVEPLLRRATFLQEVVTALRLDRVTVVRDRAESAPVERADVVTARAVAPLERLAGWCLPLVAPGGALLALKGERAEEELASARVSLTAYGAVSWTVEVVGAEAVDPPTRVVRGVLAPGADPVPRPASVRPGGGSGRRSKGRRHA